MTAIATRTLVLAMVDRERRLQAGPLYDAATRCGMSHQQVRLCLRRLLAEGVLQADSGRGRFATFVATPQAATAALPELEYLRLAYRQDAGLLPWDGQWHLAAFTVPEAQRARRDDFRQFVQFLGGAALSAGLYVSPHAWEPELRARAAHLDILPALTTGTTRDLVVGLDTDPRSLALRLWDLTALAARWQGFTSRTEALAVEADADADRRVATLLAAVEFAALLESDPLLPVELLQSPWPGQQARLAMADLAAWPDSRDTPLAQRLLEMIDEAVAAAS